MTERIVFDQYQSFDAVRVEISAHVLDDSAGTAITHALWFESSVPLPWDPAALAVALSTLCGGRYERIHYSWAVPEHIVSALNGALRAEVTCEGIARALARHPREGNVLSFSGGFDSLAARALMPSATKLVSMDLGGRFTREREFFDGFSPVVISSNLIDTPLRYNSWSFMGIAAILSSSLLNGLYLTFGGILEASPDNLRVCPALSTAPTFGLFSPVGYVNAGYTAGLTEIGTLSVLIHQMPEIVSESLHSVASPGEEKLYRKWVLANLVAERQGVDLSLSAVNAPGRPHFKFGENFAVDLLSLYVRKFGGAELRDSMVRDVPPEVDLLCTELSLKFFERMNPVLYRKFPSPLIGGLIGKLAASDIEVYGETDWREYAVVRELLSSFYPAVAR